MRHRMAIVGCGGICSSNHLGGVLSLRDRLEIGALVDIQRENAEKLAGMLPGNPRVCTDYHDAFADCDCMLLALPHHLHCGIGVDCLRAGRHVLMEKPLANTEEECQELIRASRESGRTLMVGYCMRYNPLVAELRRLIREKVYGECFQVSIWTEQYTHSSLDWKLDRRKLGGGQLFSHGCHYIDLLLWMLGQPLYGCHVGSNLGTPWMSREGTSNVCIKFAGGAMGYHFGTWGARGTKLGFSIHAHCERGMLEIDFSQRKLLLHDNAKEKPDLLLETDGVKQMGLQLAHFLDRIEDGGTPLTNAEDSLKGLEIIWKLYDAEEHEQVADLRGMGF